MKIAIGTVQFGTSYGIANDNGQVSLNEISSILALGMKNNIDTLDTAVAYGDSEKQLGEIGIKDWRVVTKLPPVPVDCDDVYSWVHTTVCDSLSRLKTRKLHGLLLHKPQQLLENSGSQIYSSLEKIKSEGLVDKIGVSIYGPEQLDLICGRYGIDLVQSPLNLLDRRLILSGWMDKLESAGIEIHVRSIFLQGLLLSDDARRNTYFSRWNTIWKELNQWIQATGLSPIQACLGYIQSFSQISRVVVGTDSAKQFSEILDAASGAAISAPESISTSDRHLIDPSCWPKNPV